MAKKLSAEEEKQLAKAKALLKKYSSDPSKKSIVDALNIKIDLLTGVTPKPSSGNDSSDCPKAVTDGLAAIDEAIRLMRKSGSGGDIDDKKLMEMIDAFLLKNKIGVSQLDDDVIKLINKSRSVEIKFPDRPDVKITDKLPEIFWTAFSDLNSQNNVYLFGGAGTGKTWTSKKLAKALNATLITINCNQYTSPLELIGGQTIEGYQQGKLITAWGNLTEDAENGVSGGMQAGDTGCLLLLDELPKLDPNTAGILNDALAQMKDPGNDAEIQDARGVKFTRKNFYCIATGNAQLNREEPDYVANFKQDLSLQDRFMGSIYEIFVPIASLRVQMEKYLFIFNYMSKVGKIITSEASVNKSIPSFGFVSIRIMQSLRDSWIYWYTNHKDADGETKTLELGLDSFFTVFLPSQAEWLKKESNYKDFLTEINKMKREELGYVTPEQKKIADKIVSDYEKEIAAKRAK